MAQEKEGRSGIISVVSTPIQLAALIVLVVEALLAYLLSKAQLADISLYVIMMVAVLLITIVAVFIIEYKRIRVKESHVIPPTGMVEKPQKTYKYDVFLAAPMAALSNDDFESALRKENQIKKALEEECNFSRVFFAGTNMRTKDDFETADVSIETDVNAIKESQYFVMVYPEKIVTSVLFEAGIAFALGKPSFYFGQQRHFPFLMQQAHQRFDHVKLYEADSLDKIIQIIKVNKAELFKDGKSHITDS